jgi:hypothetical protein
MTSFKQELATDEKTANSALTRKKNKKLLVAIISIVTAVVILTIVFVVIPKIEAIEADAMFAQFAVTPVLGQIQPASGYYLGGHGAPGPYYYRSNDSRIFVVASSISVGTYPYDNRTSLTPPFDKIVVVKGEPCIIINVTLRNDYSPTNPPPNYEPDEGNYTYVYPTAELFSGTTNLNATDMLKVGWPSSGGLCVRLQPGESGWVQLYLAVQSREEITSYKISAWAISGIVFP